MSPIGLRRYRAERLLREQFDALRGRVLATARAKLRGHGVSIPESDLESCYSIAWQGLYAAILDGEQIENPGGWLALVTYRRAIDEQRARDLTAQLPLDAPAAERDVAAELDDRARLRELIEGIGVKLSERERQAATLCYLQGISRAEAAQRMGISPRRMRKLMEGKGAGSPGVAAKMSALTKAISEGRFCEEQASLMRALAYGVLHPGSERHRLAVAHAEACPACRAYVRRLRGLSAVLPPVFLPGLLREAGLGGGVLGPAHRSRPAARGSTPATADRVASRASGGRVPRAGGLSASGAKLAATGALLLGVGGGVVALTGISSHAASPHAASRPAGRQGAAATAIGPPHRSSAPHAHASARATAKTAGALARSPRSRRAGRATTTAPASPSRQQEFAIERNPGSGRGASTAGSPAGGTATGGGGVTAARQQPQAGTSTAREFGIE